jgi:hypothetical protein
LNLASRNHMETERALVIADADAQAETLRVAARNGSTATVTAQLARGVNVHCKDDNGYGFDVPSYHGL